jgi:predicted dehydrogenase
MPQSKLLRVGIIGCGEITQVAHIPTIGFLSDFYQITYLCDISEDALKHCKNKVIGGVPMTTRDPQELAASPDVDVVFVVSSTESHTSHVLLGLAHNKYVFVEKPMCLTFQDADLILDAEKNSEGKVFVGYMRRYATAFLDAVKEVGHDNILYARVRGEFFLVEI